MKTRKDIWALAEAEQGVPIFGCLPGPAANAGLRYGDILLAVNGQRVSSVGEFVAAKANARKPYRFKVRREAEVFEVVVHPGEVAEHAFAEVATAVVEGRHFRGSEDDSDPQPV